MAVSYRLSTRRFGELLLERGRVSNDQIDEALRSRTDARERLGQALVRLGFLTEGEVVELLAQQFSLPIADADRLSMADPEAVRYIPEHLARQALLLALRRTGDDLEVAMGDPLDVVSLDHLRALTGCNIRVSIARPTDVREAVDEFYQRDPRVREGGRDPRQSRPHGDDERRPGVDLATLRQQVEDAPVVRLVN
jgi:hypothetical protein